MVLAIQDHFVDTCLIEMLHTSNMLRPSTPALVTITNGMGADDSTNGQQQLTEYFPELIIVHNKAQLEDFSPSHIRKIQKFYSNVFAKQSQVGQINWKYDTGLVRMTKALSHLNHESCSGSGQNVNLFFVPDLELSNAGNYQMRRNKSCEMCAVPEISYEKLVVNIISKNILPDATVVGFSREAQITNKELLECRADLYQIDNITNNDLEREHTGNDNTGTCEGTPR